MIRKILINNLIKYPFKYKNVNIIRSISTQSKTKIFLSSKLAFIKATPILAIQYCINNITTVFGVKYYAAISIWTVGIRLILFPLFVYSARKSAQLQSLLKHKDLYKSEKGHSIISPFIPLLFSGPIFLFTFLALKNLPTTDIITTGGLLWFKNLTISDPFYFLPILSTAIILGNFELSLSKTHTSSLSPEQIKLNKYLIRLMSLLLIPAISKLPSAVFIYMITNGVVSLIQNVLLTSKRDFFKIPDPSLLPASEEKQISENAEKTLNILTTTLNRYKEKDLKENELIPLMSIIPDMFPLIKYGRNASHYVASYCFGITRNDIPSQLQQIKNSVIENWSKSKGLSTIPPSSLYFKRHSKYPWLGWFPDGVVQTKGEEGPVFVFFDGNDNPPAPLQSCPSNWMDSTQIALEIFELPRAYAILWNEKGFVDLVIQRDPIHWEKKVFPKLFPFFQKYLEWFWDPKYRKSQGIDLAKNLLRENFLKKTN